MRHPRAAVAVPDLDLKQQKRPGRNRTDLPDHRPITSASTSVVKSYERCGIASGEIISALISDADEALLSDECVRNMSPAGPVVGPLDGTRFIREIRILRVATFPRIEFRIECAGFNEQRVGLQTIAANAEAIFIEVVAFLARRQQSQTMVPGQARMGASISRNLSSAAWSAGPDMATSLFVIQRRWEQHRRFSRCRSGRSKRGKPTPEQSTCWLRG